MWPRIESGHQIKGPVFSESYKSMAEPYRLQSAEPLSQHLKSHLLFDSSFSCFLSGSLDPFNSVVPVHDSLPLAF